MKITISTIRFIASSVYKATYAAQYPCVHNEKNITYQAVHVLSKVDQIVLISRVRHLSALQTTVLVVNMFHETVPTK